MYVVLALISALFASVTTILAKAGLKNVKSNLATALRTGIVLIFSCFVVIITKANFSGIGENWYWIVLSGLSTGFSWLCYFKALQIGAVKNVVSVDKCSTVLTMFLAFIFLKETLSFWKTIGMIIILVGTFLMIGEKSEDADKKTKPIWIFYAIGSCVFASLTSIFAKIGLSTVDSNSATVLRTAIVLIMSWLMVFVTHQQDGLSIINKKDYFYLILSGVATGLSWIFYFWALKLGEASVVVPIDKLSVLFTVILSFVIFKEKINFVGFIGLFLLVLGTMFIALSAQMPYFLF